MAPQELPPVLSQLKTDGVKPHHVGISPDKTAPNLLMMNERQSFKKRPSLPEPLVGRRDGSVTTPAQKEIKL